MGFKTQASRTFSRLAVTALMAGLCFEVAHAIHEPPQPHTDSHEVIENISARLRDAQRRQPTLRAIAVGANRPRDPGQSPPA